MNLDDSRPLPPGAAFDLPALWNYLKKNAPGIGEILQVRQFTGGYSNLSYSLQTIDRDYVLRRPPPGAAIRSGHDMAREFRVLDLLQGNFARAPKPVLYCADASVLGSPFYLMEHVPGLILRPSNILSLNFAPAQLRIISTSLVDNLVELHALDIESTGLIQLGRPDGYVERQIEGWIARYGQAETDKIGAMNALANWIVAHPPVSQEPTLLHNDYKFDNVVLDSEDPAQVRGILDWEMATVGDPLMDVGAMLAYWMEAGDGDTARQYNVTWLPGQLSRQEVADHYARKSGRYLSGILFYYVFGLFKNAVIAQQIYARWKQGHSQDPRFEQLLPLVVELAEKAERAIVSGRL
ncbi:MAG: phosphotransferase family protein [Saprospiraceae bacterium]